MEPDPATAGTYDELYRLYRELYPATRDAAHALAARQHATADGPVSQGVPATSRRGERSTAW
ncbi:hypothetical protein ABVG11_34440 [Streptomyces sp. HD1123-B1]|uniref:hypothetical protein n=1 Tax=Streptomyces huangiella TaxID=3228804 RepID=UPI003D7CF39C